MQKKKYYLALLGIVILSGCSPDYIASRVTGRECSVGYVQEGEDWCAPPRRPPMPQAFCTKSWNGVDCWARPDLMANVPPQVAEGPTGLTQDQNAKRLNLPVKKVPPTNSFTP